MTATEPATIRIGAITYGVERLDSEHSPYRLHGPRGARYTAMRNVPHPERMFLINDRGFTKKSPDVWLTDKNGTLEVLR